MLQANYRQYIEVSYFVKFLNFGASLATRRCHGKVLLIGIGAKRNELFKRIA